MHQRYVSQVQSMEPFILPDIKALVTVPSFYLAFFGENDVQTYRHLAHLIRQSDPIPQDQRSSTLSSLSYVAPHVYKARNTSKTRTRVGFISMFFKEHASGKMIQGIISSLSSELFEVYIFCIKEKAGTPKYTGTVAHRIQERADEYIELEKPFGLSSMRETIAKKQLEVLVFAEIGMDPVNYLLAFSRLAPIQVVTHGHASTTGIDTLDYFISYKPFEVTRAQAHYSEKLISFSSFSPYFKPEVPNSLPSRNKILTDLGLKNLISDDPKLVLYICLQTIFKLTPQFDDVFRKILERVPNSHLLLKEFRSPKLTAKLTSRFSKTIPTVMQRIHFLPGLSNEQWFGILKHGDVILDSYPFGGYTTSLEAFAVGDTPIVTLPNPRGLMAGRCTKGFFDMMGIDDTIAESKDEFVNISVRLAHDLDFQRGVRLQIASASWMLWQRNETVSEWSSFLSSVATGRSIEKFLHEENPHWYRIRVKPDPSE
eukprot:m.34660 g.34660  ORF g.34660 m.34660 type:complete len:484 (+) comp8759_c0_seq2:986-2437(+)